MIEIERHLKPVNEISMIPLINVVFLLLIFFLVAGTLEQFDVLKVDPPIAESGEELYQGAIVIVLGRREEVLLNDELTTIDRAMPWLEKQLSFGKDRAITVKADGRLPATALIDIIEKIRKAGGKNLTLAVQSI